MAAARGHGRREGAERFRLALPFVRVVVGVVVVRFVALPVLFVIIRPAHQVAQAGGGARRVGHAGAAAARGVVVPGLARQAQFGGEAGHLGVHVLVDEGVVQGLGLQPLLEVGQPGVGLAGVDLAIDLPLDLGAHPVAAAAHGPLLRLGGVGLRGLEVAGPVADQLGLPRHRLAQRPAQAVEGLGQPGLLLRLGRRDRGRMHVLGQRQAEFGEPRQLARVALGHVRRDGHGRECRGLVRQKRSEGGVAHEVRARTRRNRGVRRYSADG